MVSFGDILTKIAPVFAMLAIGYLFKRRAWLKAELAAGMKTFVARVTLPAVIFGAFSAVRIDGTALVVFVAILATCLAALGLGLGLDAILKRRSLRPFLMTAFEAGMLGYPLFSLAFGAENLPSFAMADLGEIVFTFTVLIPLLNQRNGGPAGIGPALKRLATNPIIWAVGLGLAAAISGFSSLLSTSGAGKAFLSCLSFIGAPTGAIILFIIGYDLDFSLSTLGKAASTIGLRYLVMVPLYFAAWAFISAFAPGGSDPILRAAVLVLFIMPSTFAIPLFGREGEESRYISATLSLNTLVTVCLLAGVTLIA
jgi:predicted permease